MKPSQFIKKSLLILLPMIFLAGTPLFAQGKDDPLVWGTTALTLPPPLAGSPSLDDLLADETNVVSLRQFYLAGGKPGVATPVECRMAFNRDDLFAVFLCSEKDMSFPAISQRADWYSLLHSPSEQDSGFPDKVDLFVQPDMSHRSYYQFAATLDGQVFGCRHLAGAGSNESAQTDEDTGPGNSARTGKIRAFTATVARKHNQWIAFFSIPWKTLGGKPADYFGLLPMRTRWRDGEVSSPVAMDFNERPPGDLFIETHFSGNASVQPPATALIQLPSGVLRWQRPALLSYPGAEVVSQIWQMQQHLSRTTDPEHLASRLYLTQRWMDLLTLEGFNFHAGTGSIVPQEMGPGIIRRKINAALRDGQTLPACRLLDGYLAKLDAASRKWFADGSPGDILTNEWQPVSKLEAAAVEDNVLKLQCLAGTRQIHLCLSLPASGGVRIHGDAEGYFRPSALLPLNPVASPNSCAVETTDGRVIIENNPFSISFLDSAGIRILHIGPAGIAFRFDSRDKITAVDFRGGLDANECIYGFGEKYDRFNQAGNVLTLWGMDDWAGNTVGLMNQSYKPVPLFHSSRHYMIFDNSSYRLRADIGVSKTDEWRLTQQGPIFDCYFWLSSPEMALQSYTTLAGKPILPPKWAFEPWIGRTGRGWSKPSNNPVAEEESVVKQFEKLDIPHSAIYAEGGGNAESPELNRFMSARGIRVLSWFFPVIPGSTQARLMPEIDPARLPVLHTEDPWEHVDFTNPNALELLRRWWKQRLVAGVAGSMVDFGDRITEDAVFYDGRRGDQMHNFYSYDYQRTCNEVFREKRGDDFILFGRAAAPGTQKWAAQFAGDHPSNFAGLRGVLTGALNLCACGFSTWGSDLGGFLGWPEPAVYMRWTQFGCFSPLMRCHGRTPREPWHYGDRSVANYKYYAWVRENLLDYIFNAANLAHETGLPMMRSLAVACPDQPALAAVADEYMFGTDLLVAPVIDEDDWRTVHFPSGRWTSLWNGDTVSGPANINTRAPLDTIPVYLKSGAVVPAQMSPTLALGASMSKSRVRVLIVTTPETNESRSWLDDQGRSAEVILRPGASGFETTLKNLPATEFLLVYGCAAHAVTVNGHVLSRAEQAGFAAMREGWLVDSNVRRTVIRLPAGEGGALTNIDLKF